MGFPIRTLLFFVAAGVVSLVVALHASPTPAAAALVLATLWLGFVVAASIAQPITSSDFGFDRLDDTGDGVVSATNAVEAALACGLLAVYYAPGRSHLHAGSAEFVALVAMFGVQALVFHCANCVIQSAIKAARTGPADELNIHRRWRAENENWWTTKLVALHGLYMVAELTKVALLAAVVVAVFGDLSK